MVQQCLPGLILNTIPGIICELGDPYDAKPGLGGMTTYLPGAMAAANKNESGAPFQYAESLFAALTVVKSMTGLPHRHLQGLEDASIHQTQLHGSSDSPNHSEGFFDHVWPETNLPCLVGRQGLTYYQQITATVVTSLLKNFQQEDMGLLARIRRSFDEPYDKYARNAHHTLERVRIEVRGKYGDDFDVVRPKEAEELRFRIRCMNEQGGLEVYKHALARWQIFKALYPEWITDVDRPKFISECWKNPSCP